MFRRVCSLLTLATCWAIAARGQPPTGADGSPEFDPAAVAQWPLERIEFKGGRVLEGLLLPSTKPGYVRFESVGRPRGRPMYLIAQTYPEQSVAKIERLPPEQRVKLAQRLEQFKSQAAEEVAERSATDQLDLEKGEPSGARWVYQSGPWFRLESWTDEKMTRKSILRIEQIFAAYSEILPPRSKSQKQLRILLYGTMRDYHSFQKGLDYRFQNPAVYVPTLNVLAAGSELTAYANRLAEVDRRHAAIQARYDQLAAAMPAELRKLSEDLEKSGVPAAERRNTRLAAERKWKQELAEVRLRIQAIERSNIAQFDLVTGEMFARLYHEAFHAYLENFVYPQRQYEVPRWLNEGLAQVFEDGLLELGTLRLDAPSPKRLAALQADLQRAPRLVLAELLTADGGAFLVAHPTNAQVSQRHYLYSWGLAHYLAVREPILEVSRLDQYVDRRNQESNPIARFEQLIGMPLAQFEARWREEILGPSAPAKP
ncbi:MAG: DUF1570 domain-containing protein [Pirellulales bacterium]